VREDPEEKGLRKILNAGHTIGHAVESYFLSKDQPIMHGEAVIIGLISEFKIGENRGFLDSASLAEIGGYLVRIYGKMYLPSHDLQEIATRCLQDKKNRENRILCVLPNGVGRAQWNVEISLEEIVESLAFYNSLQM
jgi:3-dehydroquinate synthase